jgi:NADH-quinone oxidoreductase subunit H
MDILKDPIGVIAEWLGMLMADFLNLPEMWINVILIAIGAMTVVGLLLLNFILQTWLERKVAGRIQDRIGPNRVGPFGLLQPIADTIKMVTKEDIMPEAADPVPFQIAPVLAVLSVLLIWAVVPFSANIIGADLNVAVLYIAAVGSFGILSVIMAGWSSNNKYALLGAFRAVAQLVSYEVPMFLALLVPVLLARSMSLNDIVARQELNWFVFSAPVAFVIFIISSQAEAGRGPFDLLEAESELVAGYHVEYSGMKFGLFQAGEFMHAFTAGALISLLFFGGWNGPGVAEYPPLGFLYLGVKTFFFYFVTIWVRLTLPRIRIDQMLNLNWKFLVPLNIVLLMIFPLADYFTKSLATYPRMAVLFGVNLVIGVVALEIARRQARAQQVQRVPFPVRPLAVPPKDESAGAA